MVNARTRLAALERIVTAQGLHLGRCAACNFPRQTSSAVVLESEVGLTCELCHGPVDRFGESLEVVGADGGFESVYLTVIGFRPRTDGSPTPPPQRGPDAEDDRRAAGWAPPSSRSF